LNVESHCRWYFGLSANLYKTEQPDLQTDAAYWVFATLMMPQGILLRRDEAPDFQYHETATSSPRIRVHPYFFPSPHGLCSC
jgi:hypothetical protein